MDLGQVGRWERGTHQPRSGGESRRAVTWSDPSFPNPRTVSTVVESLLIILCLYCIYKCIRRPHNTTVDIEHYLHKNLEILNDIIKLYAYYFCVSGRIQYENDSHPTIKTLCNILWNISAHLNDCRLVWFSGSITPQTIKHHRQMPYAILVRYFRWSSFKMWRIKIVMVCTAERGTGIHMATGRPDCLTTTPHPIRILLLYIKYTLFGDGKDAVFKVNRPINHRQLVQNKKCYMHLKAVKRLFVQTILPLKYRCILHALWLETCEQSLLK